jgi:hypothetical protein
MPENSEWPAHYPADCPDPGWPDTNGTLFHFVNESDSDFKSAYDNETWVGYPECERVSLSCWDTLERAKQRRRILKKFHEHKIARIELTDAHGKMLQTGRPGHHSLWLRSAPLTQCRDLFVVVPE